MAKSIKIKKFYMDSSGITHNRELLSEILEPSYCSMNVNGVLSATTGEPKTVTSFYNSISKGGFVADTTNGRLEIPKGTETIEVTGMLCGRGNTYTVLEIVDENNVAPSKYSTQFESILVQGSGNNYWKHPLPTKIIELDKTKKHYIYLVIEGYNNVNFNLNIDFGNSSWIQAKKIS